MTDSLKDDVNAEAPDDGPPRPVITDLLVNMFIQQFSNRQQYDKIYRAKGIQTVDKSQYGNLNNPQVQAAIRESAVYFIEELMEAINLLKNKPWKQAPRETDPEMFYEELADAWHFWLELMIVAGMTPDRVQKHYFKKTETNAERRETGY